MAPKKRTTKIRTTKKRIAKKKPSVRLTPEEIRVLASDLRRSFYHVFSRGYRMEFHNGENHLTMEPGRKLDPTRTRRCMEYLGIDPEIGGSAVSQIERQEQTPPPKDDHVRMDTWFRTLAGLSHERIRGLVAITPEAKRKWEIKLRRNKMEWSDVHLSPTDIARLTQRLYLIVMRKKVKSETIRQQHKDWKKGKFPVPNGGRHITFFAQSGFPQKSGPITIY